MSGGRVLLVLFSGLWVFSASVYAQSTSALPRLSDGQPNLQGIWDFRTLTPLQRPQEQDNAVLSVEEAAEIEARSAARTNQAFAPSDVREEPLPAGGDVGAYNQYWVDLRCGCRWRQTDVTNYRSSQWACADVATWAENG